MNDSKLLKLWLEWSYSSKLKYERPRCVGAKHGNNIPLNGNTWLKIDVVILYQSYISKLKCELIGGGGAVNIMYLWKWIIPMEVVIIVKLFL